MSARDKAAELLRKRGVAFIPGFAKVLPALEPVLEGLVNEESHTDALMAIASADAIILDGEQGVFSENVVRFVVIDEDGCRALTPLPGTKRQLDIVLVRRNVKCSLALVNDGDAFLRQEFLVETGASVDLSIAHIGASGSSSRQTVLLGEGSSLDEREIVVGDRTPLLDCSVVHAVPGTSSRIRQSGAIWGAANGSAFGMVRIPSRSARTDSFLSQQWLLLSSGAKMKAVPCLEIECDEVRAGHSASVRPISDEQMHYLRSRGLDERSARAAIVRGFLGELPSSMESRLSAALEAVNG